MNIGNKNISSLFFGNKAVQSVFLGSKQIYSNSGYAAKITVTIPNEAVNLPIYIYLTESDSGELFGACPDYDLSAFEYLGTDEDNMNWRFRCQKTGTFSFYFKDNYTANLNFGTGAGGEEEPIVIDNIEITNIKNIGVYSACTVCICGNTVEYFRTYGENSPANLYLGKNIKNIALEACSSINITIDPANNYIKKVNYSLYDKQTNALLWYSGDETTKVLVAESCTINRQTFYKNTNLEILVCKNSTNLNIAPQPSYFPALKYIIIKDDSIVTAPNRYSSGSISNARYIAEVKERPNTWFQDTSYSSLVCLYGAVAINFVDILASATVDDYFRVDTGLSSGAISGTFIWPNISGKGSSSSIPSWDTRVHRYYTDYTSSYPCSATFTQYYTGLDSSTWYRAQVSDASRILPTKIYLFNNINVSEQLSNSNVSSLKAIYMPKGMTMTNGFGRFPDTILFCEEPTKPVAWQAGWFSSTFIKSVVWGATEQDFWSFVGD